LIDPDFEQVLPFTLQLEYGKFSSHLVRLVRHRVQALATCFRLTLDLRASDETDTERVGLWTAINVLNMTEIGTEIPALLRSPLLKLSKRGGRRRTPAIPGRYGSQTGMFAGCFKTCQVTLNSTMIASILRDSESPPRDEQE
jgi:hypothetical protein